MSDEGDTSDGEEDWFERALREEDANEEGELADEETESQVEPDSGGEGDDWDGAAGDEQGDWSGGTSGDGEAFGETSTFDGTDGEVFGDVSDSVDETGDGGGASDSDGDAAPFGGGGTGAFGGGDEAGASSGESDEMFDEGFAEAFGGAGEGDGFEEEEEFETDIARLDLGIEGLDNMIQGGVPRKHLIAAIGSAGTGKTTFGLQFLHHGLRNGEKAVFITLEQSHESIIATANERGWDFDGFEEEGMLAVVDLDPVEMANSLDNIQAELPELIRDFGADRLVLDSVSLLEMMYDDQARRRTEVFDFTRALKKAGVTTFLTSEASSSNPYASRHGIIEYLTDAVFILQYVRGETQETRLAVEIQKIRNANHSREQKPYEMTDEGISVYQQANIF
jgi:KaiC domain protein